MFKRYNILVGTALTFLSFDAIASVVPDLDSNQAVNSTSSNGQENNHNHAGEMESNPAQRQGVNGYGEALKTLRNTKRYIQSQEIRRLVEKHGEIYSEYFVNASLYGAGVKPHERSTLLDKVLYFCSLSKNLKDPAKVEESLGAGCWATLTSVGEKIADVIFEAKCNLLKTRDNSEAARSIETGLLDVVQDLALIFKLDVTNRDLQGCKLLMNEVISKFESLKAGK